MPRCLIIAGPNGAGKTTFALTRLREIGIRRFINADMIAVGLSPLDPDAQQVTAARLFLEQLEDRVSAGEDFAFETTLSGRSYLKRIQRLRSWGWTVELIYLALPSVEMSRFRVAERVAHGGHDIPVADIERRFPRSLRNLLTDYRMEVDTCVCYMNSKGVPVEIFEQASSGLLVVNPALFEYIGHLAGR